MRLGPPAAGDTPLVWVLRFLDCASAPPAPAAAQPSFRQVLSAGGVVAQMHQVSAVELYRRLCIPMRMSARKGLSYGRHPDRSVCNHLT